MRGEGPGGCLRGFWGGTKYFFFGAEIPTQPIYPLASAQALLFPRAWIFPKIAAETAAETAGEARGVPPRGGVLGELPRRLPGRVRFSPRHSEFLVGACLATGDRIFATGSDSVSKIVLRSCGCFCLISGHSITI